MKALRSAGSAALPAALGLVGTLLILVREASYGIALATDSRSYLSIAQSLLEGAGLVNSHGLPGDGPPLFSVATAVIAGSFGLDVIEAAGYVNAAAFGLTVFLVTAWLGSRIRSMVLVFWAGCACVVSIRLARFGAFALTEMLFVLLVVASLFAMDRFLGGGRRRLLLLAAAACAFACLTRYIGVTLIAAGVLALLWQRGAALRGRLTNAAIWSIVSAGPPGLWAVRNFFVLGTPFGEGFGCCGFSSLASLDRATGEIVRWVFGETLFDLLAGLAAGIGAFAAGGLPPQEAAGGVDPTALSLKLAALLVFAAGIGTVLVRRRPGPPRRIGDTLTVTLSFLAVYALFLALYLPAVDLTLPTRYLVPLLPPLLVTVTAALDELLPSAPAPKPRSPRWTTRFRPRSILVSLLPALWLLLQIDASRDDIHQWRTEGFGYGSRQRVESELVRHLRDHPLRGRILTNNAPWFYFLPDFPHHHVEGMRLRLAQVESQLFGERAVGEERYVAVFYRDFWRRSYNFDLDTLGALPGMEVMALLEDGLLFRSRAPRNGAPPAREGSAAARAFRALLRGARPLADAHFNVYLDERDRRLIYVRDDCGDGDHGYTGPRLFLHVFPVDPARLSGRDPGRAFEALDFPLNHYGGSIGGRCLATRTLPDYEVAAVETGQRGRGTKGWKVRFRLGS